MAKQKKGKEPAGLKRYRLAMAAKKKGGGSRKGTSSKKSTSKKRSSGLRVVQASLMAKPVNAVAFALGAVAGFTYKDDARFVKLVKEPKNRYLLMAGAGMFGPKLLGPRLKMPEPVQWALLGVGAAGAVAAVPLMFPKLLPPPKPVQGAGSMGRLDNARLQQLRNEIASSMPYSLNGGRRGTLNATPNAVLTGIQRRPTLTGTRSYGAANYDNYTQVWT
jgi:hypothetical protein